MKLKPLHDYALIELVPPQTTTDSGLVLPESGLSNRREEDVLFGTIQAAGPKCPLVKNSVVAFFGYGGDTVKFEGKEYRLISYESVLAVIVGDE